MIVRGEIEPGYAVGLLQTCTPLADNEFVGGMDAGGSLRIDQLVIDGHFVPAIARRNQHDRLNGVLPSDERLECVDQCFRQTDGPRRVVSRHTKFNRDTHVLYSVPGWGLFQPCAGPGLF